MMMTVPLYLKNQRVKTFMQGIPLEVVDMEGDGHHRGEQHDLSLHISCFVCLFVCLFVFWLCWVFVSVRGLSLVAASGGHSSSRCAGLSCCGAQAPDAQAQ